MASSSQPLKKHDVFISFRGEDTRFNFTSHLHRALCRNHIETYIDYRLEKGDEVWPSLEKAIEDSILFLVILSESYASSTWCLKELTKILECSKDEGHLVMPVFYKVDPSHVRKQSESYQKAFKQHEDKGIDKKQLQKWREALTHAANLSGWHCSPHSDEGELIEEMVEGVIHKLGCKNPTEDYLEGLIGIRRRMAEVELLLHKGSNNDVRFIGIWGMGGMGKTTLAKALFDKLHFAYEGSCFLENVSAKSKKYEKVYLKKKLSKLLGGKKSHIGWLDYAIKRQTNFIVLDDVDNQEQLENLAKSPCWLGPGSKILITSRDKHILRNIVGDDDIYIVEAFNFNEAFQLLSLKSSKTNLNDPEVWKLAANVIGYANGNPLALRVLGSMLNGRNKEAWVSQLKKLKNLPHPEVNDILQLSFEGLDNEEKNIFLHIVCFFNEYNVNDVTNCLKACGYSIIIGLEHLVEKALLDICKGRIRIHNLIQEMGRHIVRENSYPKICVRIWNCNEIYKILKDNEGNTSIEGIILEASDEIEEKCSSLLAFRLPNLRFLVFHKDSNENKLKFPGGIEVLPNKLVLLCWEGYPSKSLPATFKGEHLVQIQLRESKLTKLWDGVQNLLGLREIDLAGSRNLIELPNFSKATYLRKVNLENCSKLQSVDPSILSLHSLYNLNLAYCIALTSLTSTTHLKSLIHIDVRGCSRLNKFSVTSEYCPFHVTLVGTAINGELCSSSGQLSKIESLDLDQCKSVTSLHKLFDLRNVRELIATGCNKLALNLRPMFDEMRLLETLWLDDCSELFEVPDNISLLSSLRDINLTRSNVRTLPLSIKQLWRLDRLLLEGCERLQFLLELPPSISTRSADNCQSLGTSHLSHIHYYDNPYFSDFTLTNCMNLDGQSIKAVEAHVLLHINNGDGLKVKMEYPGESVPEWFMYRTTQPLVTIDLHSIPQPWDGRLIFCVVMSKPLEQWIIILVKWFIDGQHAYTCEGYRGVGPLLSDHVILWSSKYSFEEVQRQIEKRKRDYESNTYHPLLKIQFAVPDFMKNERLREIIEYGVCPTSALAYQDYIKQVQLASPPHPNSIEMQAPSRKRKYHSLLR